MQILLYSTCVCANMAQILRKKDTITVDDMKKEAEREARTMWQFVRTFLKWLVIAGVTGGIGGYSVLASTADHRNANNKPDPLGMAGGFAGDIEGVSVSSCLNRYF